MGTAPNSQLVRVNVTARTSTGSSNAVVVEVPAGHCDPTDLLPALQILDDALITEARRASEAAGRSVTCRKGCGMCCRQLVPVTEMEANWLMALVETFPTARRAFVRSRFETAATKLSETGRRDTVMNAWALDRAPLRRLAVEYFRLGIACPFLRDEQCSIYPERPLACREYLVTSPAQDCETLGRVDRVPVPGRLSSRLAKANRASWIPLVLAPEWIAGHRVDGHGGERRTGPELLAEALGTQLGDKEPSGVGPVDRRSSVGQTG